MQRVFVKSGLSPQATYLPACINPRLVKEPPVASIGERCVPFVKYHLLSASCSILEGIDEALKEAEMVM